MVTKQPQPTSVGTERLVQRAQAGDRAACDALREAVKMAFEFEAKAGAEVLGKAAFGIVSVAKSPRDTLVPWHLLQLDPGAFEAGVERRLLELAGTPGKQPAKAWSRDTWLEHLLAVAWNSPK